MDDVRDLITVPLSEIARREDTGWVEVARRQLVANPVLPILPPYVSGSLIQLFNDCPHRFANYWLLGKKGDGSTFRFGTAWHETIEKIGDDWTPQQWIDLVETMFEEPSERDLVDEAIKQVLANDRSEGNRTIAKEQYFETNLGNGLTLTCHLDHLLVSEDQSTLIIRDYKTNRVWEPAVAWANKVQPRAYNLVARKFFPGYARYRFEIWYPRTSDVVQWYLEEVDDSIVDYITHTWNRMNHYYQMGFGGDPTSMFPQSLNQYCGYCPVRSTCATYAAATSLTERTVHEIVEGETMGQAYARLGAVAKIAGMLKDEYKEKILAEAGDLSKGERYVDASGLEFRVQQNTLTSYDTDQLRAAIAAIVCRADIDVDDLIKISPSGVKKLLADHPEFKSEFNAAVSAKKTDPFIVANPSRAKKH